jgi:hypothetical protein
MNSRIRTGILVALAATCWSGAAGASAALTDDTLDAVTAGTAAQQPLASGGAVVGNNSQAVLDITGTLDLSGEAQSGARGLNVVNSSESTVANGVNVWDGKLDAASAAQAAQATFEVDQTNMVEQEQRRVAFLPSYERTGVNSSKEWTEDSTHSSLQTRDRTDEVRDTLATTTSRELTSSGSVSTETTVAGQTIRGGRGIAGAGDLGVNFDGGNIDLTIEGNIADVLEGSINLTIELPELDIAFNGGGCAVQMGSCTGEGSLSESSSEERDNSVITTLATRKEESGTFVGSGSEEIRSPFQIADAQAEYIVLDDSKIEVASNYGITLAGSAQSQLSALNAVNAAGSAVANGVNISRMPTISGGQTLALNQQNIIRHSR